MPSIHNVPPIMRSHLVKISYASNGQYIMTWKGLDAKTKHAKNYRHSIHIDSDWHNIELVAEKAAKFFLDYARSITFTEKSEWIHVLKNVSLAYVSDDKHILAVTLTEKKI